MTANSAQHRPDRHFLAISDSASLFVPAWKPPACLEYLIGMTETECPTIVFVGAANGDSAAKQALFYGMADRVAFTPRVLSLFSLSDDRPERMFAGADAIYIDGGSTRNLLALMREWRADEALADSYRAGIPVAGASAGANLMFEWGLTDSVLTRIDPLAGLGLIPGTISVHHSTRPDRPAAFEKLMETQPEGAPRYLLKDGQFAHFQNEECVQVVDIP